MFSVPRRFVVDKAEYMSGIRQEAGRKCRHLSTWREKLKADSVVYVQLGQVRPDFFFPGCLCSDVDAICRGTEMEDSEAGVFGVSLRKGCV